MDIFLDVGQEKKKKIIHVSQKRRLTSFTTEEKDCSFQQEHLSQLGKLQKQCSEIVPQKYPRQLVRFDKVSFLPGNNRLPHLVNFPLALIRLSANAEMN